MDNNVLHEQRLQTLAQFKSKREKALKNLCLVGLIVFALSLLISIFVPIVSIYGEAIKWGDVFDIPDKQLQRSVFGQDIKTGKTLYIVNIIVSLAGLAVCGYCKFKNASGNQMIKMNMLAGIAGVISCLMMTYAQAILSIVFSDDGKASGIWIWLLVAAAAGYYAWLSISAKIYGKGIEAIEHSLNK